MINRTKIRAFFVGVFCSNWPSPHGTLITRILPCFISRFFTDHNGEVLDDEVLTQLVAIPNVILTGHQAFLTRDALASIADQTLDSAKEFATARATVPLGEVPVLARGVVAGDKEVAAAKSKMSKARWRSLRASFIMAARSGWLSEPTLQTE